MLKPNQTLFDRTYSSPTQFFFDQKKSQYIKLNFSDFQNHNFLVL